MSHMPRWTRFGLIALLIIVVPSATHAAINRSLSIGSQGSDVLDLQELLRSKGFFTYPVSTGYFGPSTAQAVSLFQRANGLEAVGNVGPLTRNLINSGGGSGTSVATAPSGTTGGTVSTGSTLTTLTRSLDPGAVGPDVTALQTALKSRGLLNEDPTGVFDTNTVVAVLAFQAVNGLETVGRVGPQTRTLLNQVIASIGSTFTSTGSTGSTGSTNTTSTALATNTTTSGSHSSGGGHSSGNSGGGRGTTSSGGGGGGGGGSSTPAPTLTLTSSAATLPSDGGSITLTWSSTNATSCTASGGWTGSQSTSGSKTISGIKSSSTYTLTCTGSKNQTVALSVSVAVAPVVTPTLPAPTLTLTSSPASLPSDGGSVTLTWSTSNATSCTASDGWTGTKAVSGSSTITGVTTAKTFTLTCIGNNQTVAKSVSVAIAAPLPAPTVTLSSSVSSVPSSGGSTTLTWSSTNATTCTASNGWTGTKATSGSSVISGITTAKTFTLTCTGNGQTAATSVSVTVDSPLPAPTVTLTSSVSSVPSGGGSATLSWSSTNATSCVASNGWTGTKATSGSSAVSVTNDTTFTLTCTGNGQTAAKNVSVTVDAPVTTPTDPTSPSTLSGTYPVYSGCEAPATNYLRTIYIDPVHGSDTTGDGSQAHPYQVLQKFFDNHKYQSGDHIILMAGNHGPLYLSQYGWADLATQSRWIWLDFQQGAIVTGFDLRDVSRFLITKPEVTASAKTIVALSNNNNIVIADGSIYTVKNSSSWTANDWMNVAGNGLSTRNSYCVSILRNTLTNVRVGMAIYTDDGVARPGWVGKVLIQDNTLRGYSADGIDPNASDVLVYNNLVTGERVTDAQGDGNHDDAMQMYALNGAVYNNIVIDHNWIQDADVPNAPFQAPAQGITNFDGLITNLRITNNMVLVGAYHGITVNGAPNAVVTGNTVAHDTPDTVMNDWIQNLTAGSNIPYNSIIQNNVAPFYKIDPVIIASNNVVTSNPADVFTRFDVNNVIFDMHPKPGSILDGTGAGYYPTYRSGTSAPTPPAAGSPTCTLTTSANSVVRNTPVTLTISSANATSATIDNGVGSIAVNGSKSATPVQNTTYTATVTGSSGQTSTCAVRVVVTLPAAVTPPANSSGPIMKYSFDSSSLLGSTFLDSSGFNFFGTLVGTGSTVAGKIGQALSLTDGKSGVAGDTTTWSALNASHALTVSMWVNPQNFSASSYQALFVMGQLLSGGNANYSVSLTATAFGGGPSITFSDGTNTVGANAPSGLASNQWTLITGVLNGTTAQLYENGTLVASGSNPSFTGLLNNSSKPTFGFDSTRGSLGFYGYIDDARVYNRALSASEVSQLNAGTLAIGNTPKGPVVPILRTLALGSTGSDVTTVQRVLKALGLFNTDATGYLGQITQGAITAFQKQNQLAAVGVVGPQTRALINGILSHISLPF